MAKRLDFVTLSQNQKYNMAFFATMLEFHPKIGVSLDDFCGITVQDIIKLLDKACVAYMMRPDIFISDYQVIKNNGGFALADIRQQILDEVKHGEFVAYNELVDVLFNYYDILTALYGYYTNKTSNVEAIMSSMTGSKKSFEKLLDAEYPDYHVYLPGFGKRELTAADVKTFNDPNQMTALYQMILDTYTNMDQAVELVPMLINDKTFIDEYFWPGVKIIGAEANLDDDDEEMEISQEELEEQPTEETNDDDEEMEISQEELEEQPIAKEEDADNEDTEEDKKEESTEEKKETADTDTLSDKELIDAWDKEPACKGIVANAVAAITNTLTELYKSGIEAVPQSGILAELGDRMPPLCCIKANKETATFWNEKDSGYGIDVMIKKSLKETIPSFSATTESDPTTMFPTYDQLMNNQTQCVKLHLMFQSANIPFSGTANCKNSIRKWISATKGMSSEEWLKTHNGGKKVRLTKWGDVLDWYKWVIKAQAYRYFDAAGLKPDNVYEEELLTIQNILNRLVATVQNIVVVSEREMEKDVLQTTELRIVSNTTLNTDAICATITKNLNTGATQQVKATVRNFNAVSNVLTIAIAFGNSGSKGMFAYQIIDNLLASGSTVSWDNVLLGRSENGAFKFKNFQKQAEAYTCAFAIYAGSGSGKGNMTLNILAAALASGCHLFYMDCKADGAGALGNIAWREGKEAFCFDGAQSQSNQFVMPMIDGAAQPLENHPVVNGVRTPNESKQQLPTVISKYFDVAQADAYLACCRYLRFMELTGQFLEGRSGHIIDQDTRAVIILDELTAAARVELDVRKAFYNALKDKYGKLIVSPGTSKEPKNTLIGFNTTHKDWQEAYKNDELLQLAYKWHTWSHSFMTAYSNARTKSLRNSNITLFFIFQNAMWLAADEGQYTAIGAYIHEIGNTCIKIVGKSFAANACGDFSTANTMKAPWFHKVNDEGNWAISKGVSLRDESAQVEIFKPYSIWGYPKPDGKGKNVENFFDYYIDKLKAQGDFDPASILQSAYTYADNAIRALSDAGKIVKSTGVKDFMYNAATFGEASQGFNADQYKTAEGAGDTPSSSLGEELALFNSQQSGQPQEQFTEQAQFVEQPQFQEQFTEQTQTQFVEQPQTQPTPTPMDDFFSQFEEQRTDNLPQSVVRSFNVDTEASANLNSISAAEAAASTVLQARDNAMATRQTPQGIEFDPAHVTADNLKPIDKTNYIRTTSIVNNNFFQTNNLYKVKKNLTKSWEGLLKTIVTQVGGKGAARTVYIDQKYVVVNGKYVDHGLLENDFINSLEDIAYLPDILSRFPALTDFMLSQPMFDLLNEQLDERIVAASAKEGKELALPDFLFKYYANINRIVNTTTKKAWTRRELLNPTKDRAERIKQLIEEQNARKEHRKSFDKIKENFNKAHNIKLSKEERVQSAAKATRNKKYKGGLFGWLAYNAILKHL